MFKNPQTDSIMNKNDLLNSGLWLMLTAVLAACSQTVIPQYNPQDRSMMFTVRPDLSPRHTQNTNR